MKTGNTGGRPRRRNLLELCAAAFLASGVVGAWPLAACAQQPAKVPRVGWIWAGRSAGNPIEAAGFRQGLKELGFVEGQNIIVDYRFGEGRTDPIAELVAELVTLRPDVLVALGDMTVGKVKGVTATIPVVSMTGDPVGAGLVASLARPGGNITGVSMMKGAEGLTGKRVELLKDAVPAAKRIALIYPDNPTNVRSLAHARQVASQLSLDIRPFPVVPGDEIEAVIAALSRERVDGVDIEPAIPFTDYPLETGELLLKYRIPAVSELRRIAESGGLLSYGPNLFDTTRRMAYFVDRILKGTNRRPPG